MAKQIDLGIYDLGNGRNAAIVGDCNNVGDSVDLNDGAWH